MAHISTGIHPVPKRLANGERRWYLYAWRGGPCIHVQDGPTKPRVTPEILDKLAEARRANIGTSNTLDMWIDQYRESKEFAAKKPSTQREYRLRLDQISQRMGKVPIRHVPSLRREIILWRDELADTPRAADRVVGMLSTLFSWAMDKTYIDENPAKEIRNLHKVKRADLIWEPRHWQAINALDEQGRPKVPGHVRRVFLLGSLTGLRLGDLLALQWEQVTPSYIDVDTAKTGGLATIPMHEQLRRFLVGPGRGPILLNSRCQQWTPDGFQSSWGKVKPEWWDRHTHDLRGTFATRLMLAGFTDQQIAIVIGWDTKRIAAIRALYVDRAKVAREMAKMLDQFTP